jgi:hypothetical protein
LEDPVVVVYTKVETAAVASAYVAVLSKGGNVPFLAPHGWGDDVLRGWGGDVSRSPLVNLEK